MGFWIMADRSRWLIVQLRELRKNLIMGKTGMDTGFKQGLLPLHRADPDQALAWVSR